MAAPGEPDEVADLPLGTSVCNGDEVLELFRSVTGVDFVVFRRRGGCLNETLARI